MKMFKQITLLRILFVLSILFLASCATATPKINLSVAGIAMEFNQPAYVVTSAVFSPEGQYALSGSVNGTATLWDLSGKRMLKLGEPASINSGAHRCLPAISRDGRFALLRDDSFSLAGFSKYAFNLFDLSTGNRIRTFKGHSFIVSSTAFSPDGRYILSGSYDKTIKLWDTDSGKEIRTFKGHSGFGAMPVFVDFSPDGSYAISGSWDKTIRLWEVATGKELKVFGSPANTVVFSPDGNFILSGGVAGDNTLKLWSVTTGKEVRTFSGHSKWISSAAFSPDGKYVISGSGDATLKLWDVSTGKEIRTFKGHMEGYTITNWETPPGVLSVDFSPNGRYVISAGDASIRLWDVVTAAELAMMVEFEDGEWLTITSEGYYNSSTSYSVDSFYDVFYRPDIVTAKLRGDDIKDLITITMKDAIKNPPPVVEISPIASTPSSPKTKVCYNVKSTGGGIGEVRLFHNGKLIESDGYYKDIAKTTSDKTELIALNSKTIYEDMRSVKIKEKGIETGTTTTKSKGEVFNDCKEIDAVSGENEISITAFNKDNTVQGYVQTAKFTSTIKQEEPHLYILSIGIDQYKDSTINLKYAVKDSKDIEERIIKQAETLYKLQNIHYEIITDNNATKARITTKINELSQKIKPTDSFILFAAGHGVLLQNQYYMLTADYDGKVNDNNLISSNEIVEMSKKIKSLSQLFIFDTCHAGGVDYIVSGLYDARMSVLAKKMGLHIYASANSKEAAMDGYQGNGLFTYTLLDGLNNNRNADKNKDNAVSLAELGEYSKASTTEISKKIGHQQTPLIINFGKDNAVYNLR
ncbi:MAG: wd40 repeat subgroup [Nitrospirae bacterium]|nr:MAG: wd40 repeat subgroup [Nitrospirota bacterium]